MTKNLLAFITLVIAAAGFLSAEDSAPWWNTTVFYEVYVRAFQDSDGDGKGDLKGLISRLDYLNDGNPETKTDLGVTGIWLMPLFSGRRQDGYDVMDYWKIEEDYGTLEDLKTLVKEAHKRGIKVIIDLVLNHTSNEHPWFVKALKDPGSLEREYYRFSNTLRGPFWRLLQDDPARYQYYAWFDETKPDLNLENPWIKKELFDVARYWLTETGIDGYRLDAIKYLIEEGNRSESTEGTHQWLRELYKVIKTTNPQAFALGEVWDNLKTIATYGKDQVDLNFNFPLADAISSAVNDQNYTQLKSVLLESSRLLPGGAYATFVRNHDKLRLMKEFMGDEKMSLQSAALQLTLPGIPFLYYGEEIGLSQNRKAMQWDSQAPNWGFTSGRVFSNGNQEKDPRYTVSAQNVRKDSMLSTYRNLVSLRTSSVALATGDLALMETGNPRVLAFLRTAGTSKILVVHNLSSKEESCVLYDPGKILKMGETVTSLYPSDLGRKGSFENIAVQMPPRSSWVFSAE